MKVFTVTAPENLNQKTIRVLTALLLAVAFASLFGLGVVQQRKAFITRQSEQIISETSLEQTYGLHINLLGVTAAGGMVDLRLKIVDLEKAKAFLQSSKNLPVLELSDARVILRAPDENQPLISNIHQDSVIVYLYPNARNAVQPGTSVTVKFGDIAVESLDAK